MQFLSDNSTSGPACRLVSADLGFEVRVGGLSVEEMRGLFLGLKGRMDWLGMKSRPAIVACKPGNQGGEISGNATEKDLPDGRVLLEPGGPGRLEVEEHHGLLDALVPQSLYLLLSHQWAQAGVMPIHGAALEGQGRGILVLGGKASGKSTLTAAALVAGARVISDDWLLLGPDLEGTPRVERLRQFLMLRESWATDQIRALLPEIPFKPNARRPKAAFTIPADNPSFPTGASIQSIWILDRPRTGRALESRIRPLNKSECLGRLIEASMPLLYSAGFPVEKKALMATASTVLGNCQCYQVQAGTDLITEPRETWGRLVE